ncbi:MAG: energy transducer TonB [Gammaproteobacteria bacterium]
MGLATQNGHIILPSPERSRLVMVAVLVTLVAHVFVVSVLWRLWSDRPMLQPSPPLEVNLTVPPPKPTPVTTPTPPPRIQPAIQPPIQPTPPLPVQRPVEPITRPATPLPMPVEQRVAEPVKPAEITPPPAPAAPEEPKAAPIKVAPVAEIEPPSFGAAYLNNPPPEYPAAAKRLGLQGTVLLRVLVSPAGLPEKIGIMTSSGSPSLDDAAIKTVKQWTFVPARQGDHAVAGSVNVPIRYSLTN